MHCFAREERLLSSRSERSPCSRVSTTRTYSIPISAFETMGAAAQKCNFGESTTTERSFKHSFRFAPCIHNRLLGLSFDDVPTELCPYLQIGIIMAQEMPDAMLLINPAKTYCVFSSERITKAPPAAIHSIRARTGEGIRTYTEPKSERFSKAR